MTHYDIVSSPSFQHFVRFSPVPRIHVKTTGSQNLQNGISCFHINFVLIVQTIICRLVICLIIDYNDGLLYI